MFKKFLLIGILGMSFFYSSKIGAETGEGIQITIYNQDLGLVKDKRSI